MSKSRGTQALRSTRCWHSDIIYHDSRHAVLRGVCPIYGTVTGCCETGKAPQNKIEITIKFERETSGN